MSLQGSLETIALPDVLSLLASSSKTGELQVTGRCDGQLWLSDGKLIASAVGAAHDHVEAVFQLLRLPRGDFLFQEGSSPPEPGEASAVNDVIRHAQERLAEWKVIEAAIPSLDVLARLRSELPGTEVTLPADQWRMVVAISAGRTVRETLAKLNLGEFDGCRRLKELVDAGLVSIDSTPARVASITPNEPPRPRRRLFAPVEDNGAMARPAAGVENGRSEHNGRSASAEAASAAVAQTTPARPRPNRPPPLALDQAVTAAAEAAAEVEMTPAPTADSNGARRPRRVSGTREVLAPRARPAPPEPIADDVAHIEAPPVEPVAEKRAAKAQPEVETPEDEPINRGLLLKFLSSVRS